MASNQRTKGSSLFLRLCTSVGFSGHTPDRTLRSSSETKLTGPLVNDTYQASAAKIFNILPLEIRNCRVFDDFK